MSFLDEILISKIQSTFEVFMMVSIIIVFSLNIFWSFKILAITEKSPYRWITHLMMISSFLFILVFGYLLVSLLASDPLILTSYGVLFIRPVIFMMGCALAANSRATLDIIATGGHRWSLRKSKNSLHG